MLVSVSSLFFRATISDNLAMVGKETGNKIQ
jgi:hypothetical protein